MLSKRGRKNLTGSNPLVASHFTAESNPWHPRNNPEGYINMGTAENGLLYDLLRAKMETVPPVPERLTHYADMKGTPELRSAFCSFYNRNLNRKIEPGQVVFSTGSSAILDQLAHLLFEPGDGILIPAPYYAGFDHDFTTRAGVVPVPAYLSGENDFRLTTEVLDETIIRVSEEGVPIRGLLITNPNNPLGDVYPPELVREILDFAASRNLRVIWDEIYRFSVFRDVPFTPVTDLLGDDDDHVHVVYGFAKDFGLSGFKAGVLISRNADVMKAMPQLTYFSCLSTITQHMLTGMLNDQVWLDTLQRENRKRIARAYNTFTAALDAAGIWYHKASAGFFLWMNLRSALHSSNRDGEMALYRRLFDEARVNLSPGSVFHSLESGWFRACYARDAETLEEAVKRIVSVVK